MAFVSTKIIHGKKRYYLEKSVRFPGGKVKKYSTYLKGYDPSAAYLPLMSYKKALEEKIAKDLTEASIQSYRKDPIFTELVLRRLEEISTGYRKIRKQLTKKQIDDILDRFTINFTYESNALEGNSLTLKDVTFIIQEEKILKGKDLREVYETLNTRKAFEWIFHHRPKIRKEDIIKLHEILVRDTGILTSYKRFPNFLMGRQVKTTPPEEVEREMESLLRWYEKSVHLHPLQRAAIFHGRFERIHPFEDGNGRVGRLLINIILMNHGYPPMIIRKSQRLAYFNALEAFDHEHPDKLYWFLIERYKGTYEKFFEIYIKYL